MSKRIFFTDEQRSAMRLVEGLIQEGKIVLVEDRWSQGRPAFMQPNHAQVRAVYDQPATGAAEKVLGKLVEVGRMSINDYRSAIRALGE